PEPRVRIVAHETPDPPPPPKEPEKAPHAQPTPSDPPAPLPRIVTGAEPVAPEHPLLSALRQILEKHPADAEQGLRRFDRPNQESVLALLQLTVGVSQGELDRLSADELRRALGQVDTLARLLRRRAPLELKKVCFCSRIVNYGQYEALPPGHLFQAGGGGRIG